MNMEVDKIIKNSKFEYRNSKQIQMTEIPMTKSLRRGHPIPYKKNPVNNYSDNQYQGAFVLNFEHLNFDIVSDFGFRASDFYSVV
jgi:hypothetical protein